MGWSQSKEETVQDNGVVNNSFVVDDHNIIIPLDIKVLFYILVVAVLGQVFNRHVQHKEEVHETEHPKKHLHGPGLNSGIHKQSRTSHAEAYHATEAVRNEIRDNLVQLFNTFTNTLAVHWFKLGDNQKQQYKQLFLQIRDKIIRSFQILDVKYKVPTSAFESINPQITDKDIEDSEEAFESINPQITDKDIEDSEEETVALSTIEFFNLASKLVPLQFNGSFDKLQSFLDSLALLQANSEGHVDRALAFVETRLTGKDRDLINDDMTVDHILKALKSNIKGESSKVVSAKLLNLQQNFKDTSKFATEIESLATSLKTAYITEGVPNAVAQTYATDIAVQSLIKNAASEKNTFDWEDWIKYYTFCYNTTPSTCHQYTPFELVFGKKCNLPQSISAGRIDPLYNIDAYSQEIRYRLQIAQKKAQEWLQIAYRHRKIAYDKKAQHTEAQHTEVRIGDLVLITNESRHKFDPWYVHRTIHGYQTDAIFRNPYQLEELIPCITLTPTAKKSAIGYK
ncbi:hypothetical protein QE152_g39265 [Popillia japonica]|uniref:Uncharacterized protein n=1 Tax=Popillia japonica TaxID=7064 RepID=A0AAW1HV54_POPJA